MIFIGSDYLPSQNLESLDPNNPLSRDKRYEMFYRPSFWMNNGTCVIFVGIWSMV